MCEVALDYWPRWYFLSEVGNAIMREECELIVHECTSHLLNIKNYEIMCVPEVTCS